MVEVIGKPGNIVKSALVTAFTLAAALVWRDVFVDIAGKFFPGSEMYQQIVTAIFITLIVIVLIVVTVKTEDEAEYVIAKLTRGKKK